MLVHLPATHSSCVLQALMPNIILQCFSWLYIMYPLPQVHFLRPLYALLYSLPGQLSHFDPTQHWPLLFPGLSKSHQQWVYPRVLDPVSQEVPQSHWILPYPLMFWIPWSNSSLRDSLMNLGHGNYFLKLLGPVLSFLSCHLLVQCPGEEVGTTP